MNEMRRQTSDGDEGWSSISITLSLASLQARATDNFDAF